MAHSCGLFTDWFRGIDNQKIAHAHFGTKGGVFLGEVTGVAHESVSLRLVASLKPGDGLVFDAGKPDEREEGGRVYQVEPGGDASRPTSFGTETEPVLPGQWLLSPADIWRSDQCHRFHKMMG